MNRLFIFALVFAASAAFTASCASTDKTTQITLALESETEIPKELDSFLLRVFSTRTGELRFEKRYTPGPGEGFPTTLAVIPADEDALASPVRIELEGYSNSNLFLKRRAIVSYFRNRNLLLSLPLRMACFDFKACGVDETCAGGQCIKAVTDPAKLLDYREDLVFGKAGSCFDEQTCLVGSDKLTVREDCTFDLPAGVSETDGNVSVQWAAAPSRLLGLEANDTQEGWKRAGPLAGRLSQGACDSYFQRKDAKGDPLVKDVALAVLFSATCASKTREIAYCRSATTQHTGIGAVVGPGDAGGADRGDAGARPSGDGGT